MYFLLPHWVPATWRSRAQTSIRAELPSGKLPTTRVRRRISRFSLSITLLVRMRVQCSLGKSQYPLVARQHTTSGWKKPQQYLYHCNLTASKFRKSFLWSIGQNEGMWNTTCPHFPHIRLGLNPYREIVFRSTSQIAGARTVNRLFSPLSDVRKRKGLRKSTGPSTLIRKIGFLLSFCGGAFWSPLFYFLGHFGALGPHSQALLSWSGLGGQVGED